jgi:hypothetical protein
LQASGHRRRFFTRDLLAVPSIVAHDGVAFIGMGADSRSGNY